MEVLNSKRLHFYWPSVARDEEVLGMYCDRDTMLPWASELYEMSTQQLQNLRRELERGSQLQLPTWYARP